VDLDKFNVSRQGTSEKLLPTLSLSINAQNGVKSLERNVSQFTKRIQLSNTDLKNTGNLRTHARNAAETLFSWLCYCQNNLH
jgi:hypothetical protein